MKLRLLYTLSIVGIFLVVLIQIGGMFYAYENNKKEAKRILDECFQRAFIETVDNQINNLPLPENSIPFCSYISKDKKVSYGEEAFLAYQQAASLLQDGYGVTVPLEEMERVLEKKLKWSHIDRKVWIDSVKDRSNYSLYKRFKSVVSEPAWLYESKGEAIEAVIISPFLPLAKDILFLFLPTLLLTVFLIYSWTQQMKYILKQRRGIEEQRTAFYGLTERMHLPIETVRKQIPRQQWKEIESSGKQILDMTEQTLAVAKVEEQRKQVRKQYSFKVFFGISLVASCLLLVAWFAYLYRTSSKEATYQVNDCFENAFYEEVFKHRYPLFRSRETKVSDKQIIPHLSPFARKQLEELEDKRSEYNFNRFLVIPIHNTIDLNYRLRTALRVQKAINESGLDIPLSFPYLDSVFIDRLKEQGINTLSGIRQFCYPSDSTVTQMGYASTRRSDITSSFIPLKEDSTLCVQGVVRHPYQYVMRTVWYLMLPLWIMFLIVLNCIFGQVKVLRMQHRLERHQKDFTYAMIHDMKSPLSSILIGAHILGSGKLTAKPDKEEKYKQAIEEETEHLWTLSNRVLMLTQLDEGRLQLHKEEVFLRPLLDDLIAKASLKAPKKVSFTTFYHRCESVYADAFYLREVISNLLDNAIKYSRETVEINIVCESEKGFCKIKVCDNGLGISLKDQSRIFNRFERSEAVRNSKEGGITGFGLGLNYVCQVVEAHAGTVSVESVEGNYSEFIVTLPHAPLEA